MPDQDHKDLLKQAVTAIAKDDADGAKQLFHDVLQSKMQARLGQKEAPAVEAPAAE